jgi:hypothetical protein
MPKRRFAKKLPKALNAQVVSRILPSWQSRLGDTFKLRVFENFRKIGNDASGQLPRLCKATTSKATRYKRQQKDSGLASGMHCKHRQGAEALNRDQLQRVAMCRMEPMSKMKTVASVLMMLGVAGLGPFEVNILTNIQTGKDTL